MSFDAAILNSPADTGAPLVRHPQANGGMTRTENDSPLKQRMEPEEVQAAIYRMTADAINYVDGELSPKRALATKYYQGQPFGDEQDGRSKIVATVLRDSVRKVMPTMLRIFFGAEDTVEYRPRTEAQIPMAQQATRYVSDLVVRQDNPGFIVVHDWFKDGLSKGLGIIKAWWDDADEVTEHSASYQEAAALAALHADETITIDTITPCKGQPPGVQLYDVTYTRTRRQGRIRFRCLPPEEFLFTRAARSVDADPAQPGVATYVAHRTELTKSQLLGMGVSAEDIEAWGYKDTTLDANQEEIARQTVVRPDASAIGPIPTQKVLYIEAYPFLDEDGDGIAELRRICLLGPTYHVISDEAWDDRPFALFCPDPEPHTIIGQGFNDYTMDLQRIVSKIERSMLDSLALAINPRTAMDETAVNLQDVLNTELGAIIRTRGQPGAVLQEFDHAFVGEAALEVLQYYQGVLENRIAVTKASAGLDADTLQSTTKAAVAATFTAAQQHLELMARIASETGFRRLYEILLKLVVSHPDVPRIVRSQGQYVPMDPRDFEADLDVQVNVAIGAGLDDDKFATLQAISQIQMQILQMFGVNQPLVTPKQFRDTLVKMAKLKGREDAESFFGDPPPDWQPPPPPPNPQLLQAQAEQTKAQALAQKHAADAQLDQQKFAQQTVKDQQDTDLKKLQLQMEHERELSRIAGDLAVRQREMELRHTAAIAHTAVQRETAAEKVAAQVGIAAHQTVVQAHKDATEALGAASEPITPAQGDQATTGRRKPKRGDQ